MRKDIERKKSLKKRFRLIRHIPAANSTKMISRLRAETSRRAETMEIYRLSLYFCFGTNTRDDAQELQSERHHESDASEDVYFVKKRNGCGVVLSCDDMKEMFIFCCAFGFVFFLAPFPQTSVSASSDRLLLRARKCARLKDANTSASRNGAARRTGRARGRDRVRSARECRRSF